MMTSAIDPVHVYHVPSRDVRLLDGEDEYVREPAPVTPRARPVRAFAFTVYSADHTVGVDITIPIGAAGQEATRTGGSLYAAAHQLAGVRGALILHADPA